MISFLLLFLQCLNSFVFYQHPRYLHILFFVSTIISQIPVPSSTFVTLLSSVFQMFSFQEVHILQLFLQWRFLLFRINVPGFPPDISIFCAMSLWKCLLFHFLSSCTDPILPPNCQCPGPSFTKGRKYCRRRRRKRRLYVGIYVRVESVLLKAVSSVVNVDVNVDFRATYDWSFSIEFV